MDEDRQLIAFLKSQLGGDLSKVPELVAHRKATASVVQVAVEDAVKDFQGQHLSQVGRRTQSDIELRLNRFAEAFEGRKMHSLHAGEIERWLATYQKPWTRRSYWKQI